MKRSHTSEQGAAVCLAACRDAIEAGLSTTLGSDDPEGPHQFRVGLRRLRVALALFRPAIGGPAADRLSEEAKWLGREVGLTRDLDVVLDEVLAPALGEGNTSGHDHPLLAALRSAASVERDRLRRLLGEARARRFLNSLRSFVAHRGWLLPDDLDQTVRLARPLGELADAALRHRWKRASQRALNLPRQSAAERHEFRKELKKLRYSVDFLAPLYRKRDMSAFLKRLKELQTLFGDLNDAAVATRILRGETRELEADAEALAALRRVTEDLDARSEAKFRKAEALWQRLRASRRPWDPGVRS